MDILFEPFPTLEKKHHLLKNTDTEIIVDYLLFLRTNSIIVSIEDTYQKNPEINQFNFYLNPNNFSIDIIALDSNKNSISFNDSLLQKNVVSYLNNTDIDSLERSLCEVGLASLESLNRESRFDYYSDILEEVLSLNYIDSAKKYIQNWDTNQHIKRHTFGNTTFPEFFYNIEDIELYQQKTTSLIQQVQSYNIKTNVIEWFDYFNQNKDVNSVCFKKNNVEPFLYSKNDDVFLFDTHQPASEKHLLQIKSNEGNYIHLDRRLPYEKIMILDILKNNTINRISEQDYNLFLGALNADNERKIILQSTLEHSNLQLKLNNTQKKRL